MSTRVLRKMGLQDDRDLPPVKDDASDDTETSSGGVNKKRHLNMYDLVSVDAAPPRGPVAVFKTIVQ